MKRLLLIPLLLILSACNNPPSPAAQAQSTPSIEAPTIDGDEPGSKRSIKVAIVISRMEDLQVKEGDFIAKGQIIADRTKERAQLASEKSLLIQKIEKFSQRSIPALNRSPIPPIANLPPPSFIEIHSEIQAKRLQVQEAERLARQQQRKIDMLNALPPGDLPPETLRHELEGLAATQRKITEAEAAISQSEAKLSTSQADRQQKEYEHSLKISEVAEREQQRELERNRQAQEYQKQERDREFQIAQLQTQLQSLDEKIKDVSAILSNHTGKIRKIRIAKQDNSGLHVDIQLSITGKTNASATDRNTSAAPTPKSSPPSSPKPAPSKLNKPSVTEVDELETDQNPLMPAGDSLDKIINSRINDDLWLKMLGDMPCISTQESCIKQLQSLAVTNSRELKAIDERIKAIKTKIDESKANNQKSVRIGVFEPLLQSWLKTEEVKDSSGTVRKRGILDSLLGIITRPVSGINDILGLIGLPLFRNASGGDAAAQGRVIAIGDLQVKVAEIENKRGDIAAKLRETVVINVLEFDQARREFQIGQEIAKRETARMAVRRIEYQLGGSDTSAYLGHLSGLDRVKGATFTQWAAVRGKLARIKLIVLREEGD